jgi:2-isopropylmalate synthase
MAGSKQAIIYLYNAVSPVFREVVFRNTKEQTIDLTLNAVRLVKKLTEEETERSGKSSFENESPCEFIMIPGTKFIFQYCLETFSQTEPEFAVELANRVFDEWGKATPEDPMLFALAATVECGPCNHYADMVSPCTVFVRVFDLSKSFQVEYFHNNVKNRDSVIVSIHPHNDRGMPPAIDFMAFELNRNFRYCCCSYRTCSPSWRTTS